MTEQSDNISLSEIMAELVQLRQKVTVQEIEIVRLKNTIQPANPVTPPVKNSRRQLLRQLMGGLTVTLTAGAVATGQPPAAQAKITVDNTSRYSNIAVPPTTTVIGPNFMSASVGLAASGDTSVDFSVSPPGAATGVYAKTSNGFAIFGNATGSGTAIRGNATNGTGVIALSVAGAPFRIQPGNQPTAGIPQAGEFYVSTGTTSHFFFYNGSAWVQVI